MGVVGVALRGFGKALKKAKREIKKTPPLPKETKAVGKGALIGGVIASGIEYKKRKARGDYKAAGGRIGFKRAGPTPPINLPWPKPGAAPRGKRKADKR